jgi:tetratricopeptide (TPR) repeat protein
VSFRGHLILLALVVLAGYLPSFSNGIVWDEQHQFVPPGSELRAHAIPTLFFGSHEAQMAASAPIDAEFYYRPLILSTYAVLHTLAGNDPRPFAALTVLSHVLVAVLFFAWVWRVLGHAGAAWLATLAFALHPMAAANAAWVGVRADIGVAVCVLAALIVVESGRSDARAVLAITLAYLAAALFKELALVLPPLVLLAILTRHREAWPRASLERLVFGWLVVSGVYLALRSHALPARPVWDAELASALEFLAKLAQGSLDLVLTLGLFLWPTSLGIYRMQDLHQRAETAFGMGAAAAPAVNAAVVLLTALALVPFLFARSDTGRTVRFLAAWYVLSALPSLPLLPTHGVPTSYADRHMYLPAMALAAFFGLVLARSSGRAALALGLACVCFWGVAGYGRQRALVDDEVCWAFEHATAPRAFRMHVSYARWRAHQGRFDDAMAAFARALLVSSDDGIRADRIDVAYRAGRLDQVRPELGELVARNAHVLLHRAAVLMILDEVDPERARPLIMRALEHDPSNARLHLAAARSLLRSGQPDEALRALERSLELAPDPEVSRLAAGVRAMRTAPR